MTTLRNIPAPPPLPADREALLANRLINFDSNVNDLVDDIHMVLFVEDPAYKRFLYAVHDSQAKEGSLSADNWAAANIIREYARDRNVAGVKDENLATIGRALNVVLRRCNLSRKQRRNMVHGENVPDENGNGND
jgi:hypothetical protein